MMVYSGAWLFCSLFLLCFGGISEPPQPSIEASSPVLHVGLTYNFTCAAARAPDVEYIYTWWINGQNIAVIPQDYIELEVNRTIAFSVLTCAYIESGGFLSSRVSNDYTIATEEYPGPIIIPTDPSQVPVHGQSYGITCIAPSEFIPHVTAYQFIRLSSNDSRTNFSSADSNFSAIASQFVRHNFTCAYEIGEAVSPASNDSYSLMATILTSVNTSASNNQAYYGQNVTLLCLVDTDPNVPEAPGGDDYVFQWFDGDGNLEGVTQVPNLEVTVVSDTVVYICHAAANNDVFISGQSTTITGVDLPRPTFIASPTTYYAGNSYTFLCLSTLAGLPGFIGLKWLINGIVRRTTLINLQTFIFTTPQVVHISCAGSVAGFDSPVSEAVVINVTALPAPEIAVMNPRGMFFSGTVYTFFCSKSFPVDVTSYYFTFKNNASLSTNQTDPSINVTADVNNPHNITCTIYNILSSTPESPAFFMNVVEIPKPSVLSADLYYFPGNSYIFQCQAPPMENVSYTAFSWNINGTFAFTDAANPMDYDMPEPPHALNITCHSLIDSHESVESDPLDIVVSAIPQPTIQVSPDYGFFINGTAYNFTCVNVFSSVATEYSFSFPYDNTLDRNQNDPMITLFADVSQMLEFTCIVSIVDSSSDPSESYSMMDVVVPPPPTIQLLDVPPSHYLVGTQYVLECQSDLEDFVTRYCLKNFTTEASCQSSKRFMYTAEETEQLLSCNVFFGEASTTNYYSQGVSVIGSGIVSTTANASTPTPYPGTNVTLTCSAMLTSGYNESDVTFSWKEGATLIAQTKVASVYVTTNMETSFHCEGTTGVVDVSSDVVNITARDLPTPNIEVQNRPANDTYEPGHFYVLICNSELENLLTSYNWYDDGQLVEDVHTKQYLAQAMSYTHLYSCTFVIVSEESPGSPDLMIASESIVSVHVESNGLRSTTLTPVFDSTLTLRCQPAIKSTATESPTYKWLEDGIQMGTGQELTIVAYAGYDHPVVCEVTVGDDVMPSNEVMITSREDLPAPEISLTTHQVSQILPRASYTLRCISDSLSLNSSVRWYKDLGQLSCLRDPTLYITRYDPSIHDGQYTCEIAVFGMAARSGPTVLLGIAPGKQCQQSAHCTYPAEGYTGVCQDQRCVCSDGYTPRLHACVLA